MKIIGLTGGIGSGKTTVANFFKDLGVPVFIADIEAKKLMNTSTVLINKIKQEFGNEAYVDDSLNRAYIAQQVFNNKKALAKLNSLVHPEVRNAFDNWIKDYKNAPYVIYEAAIIFELGRAHEFDKIILVTAPKVDRMQRLLERDDTTVDAIEARMNNQWSDDKKKALADVVISNIILENTEKQVKDFHKKMINH